MKPKLIPLSYYTQDDVLFLGKDLLGKVLCTCINGKTTKAIITETESYKGPEDKAAHSYNSKRTTRNEVMYQSGGHAYVFICYGIHKLFNIVTGPKDVPHAVLIRGILPILGLDVIAARRKKNENIIVGPGKVSQALGIDKNLNGIALTSNLLWLEDHKIAIPDSDIECLNRVGIEYAGDHAYLDWRFRIKMQPEGVAKLADFR